MTARRSAGDGNGRAAPLHSRIREAIRSEVGRGALIDESGRLMTEAELVKHFGVSRITIRHAIRPLVDEGMFARAPGRGTFLQSNRSENWVGRLMGFSEFMEEAGYEPGARILRQGMMTDRDTAASEALGEDAPWELRRLRLADETPIAIEHAFYPADIGAELARRDLTSIVMYRVFESDLGLSVERATQTIGAALASGEEATLLCVEPGAALIAMERLTVSSDGRPLELLRSVYLPGYFRFTIDLTRRAA